MATLNKLIEPPSANSRSMRAYMQAILEITGLMASQSFPLDLFMGNFKTHLEPKTNYPFPTLLKDEEGLYRLTIEGVRFFSSRLTAEPIIAGQKVSRREVLEMTRAILAPEPLDGWISFDVEHYENA